MLHGKTIIELHNTKTHRDDRIVHSNMLTNRYADMFKLPHLAASRWSYGFMDRNDAFGGLLMFNEPLSNDASDYGLPPVSNRMIAHADRQSYNGTDNTRGSFNSNLSTSSAGTVTNVWDFNAEQGNGVISAVCLTDILTGKMGAGTPYPIEASNVSKVNGYPSLYLVYNNVGSGTMYLGIIVPDYDNNALYTCTVASGIITIKKVNGMFPTKANFLRYNYTYSSGYGFSTSALIANGEETQTVDLSSIIGSVSLLSWCAVGTTLHFYAAGSWSNGSTKTLVSLDLTDGTYTTQTVTNNTGVTLPSAEDSFNLSRIAIYDGYLYQAGTNNRVAYINLSDNTDCGFVALPNGTEITTPNFLSLLVVGGILIVKDGEILHDNTTSEARWNRNAYSVYKGVALYIGLASLSTLTSYKGGVAFMLNDAYSFISANESTFVYTSQVMGLATKNNLETAVTKTADMTMRVTYTVTDQSE